MKLWIIVVLIDVILCLEPLRLVERNHLPRRRSLPTRKLNYGYHRDSPPLMDNVIHTPLENKRVFTKDNFYINAIHPREKEALVYESMLTDGKGSVNDIDAFFVTPPPSRTTLAPKRYGDNQLPELDEMQQISQGSVKEEEEEERRRERNELKLVTLPPVVASTIAPFKHNSLRRQLREQPQPPPQLLNPGIRFPAQSWQIPPLHQPTTPNPLAQFFQPIPQPPPAIPPNPFFPQPPPATLTPWTPPPPPTVAPWAPPPQQQFQQPQQHFVPQQQQPNNTFNPYIPIPVGEPNPNFLFQQPARPPPTVDAHRQQMRVGSFARTFGQQPIPLPGSSSQVDTAFNQAREREFSQFQPNQFIPKKPTPPIDYSVDSVAMVTKDTQPPPPRRSITEKSSEQLRNFVKVHPHVMTNMQKPMIYRGKEMVIPKMFNFTSSPPVGQPIQPVQTQQKTNTFGSTYVPLLNPNQKLDMCCRKQRVGPICQNLCNFDSFNDKTLVTAFLTNQCPGPQLGQAYDCASSKADHSQCCERAGLLSFQGGKCIPFCRTHVATPSNVFDYFVCLQVFESIKGCYREYQFTHPNIFGD